MVHASGCDEELLPHTRTTEGQSPEEFFSTLRTPDGTPRYVQLVGVPGSGKSTWSRVAQKLGWKILSTDALRIEALTEMRDRGDKLQLADGSLVIPDPKNWEHVFSPPMLREGFVRQRIARDAALARGLSIIDDKVNMNLHRTDDLVAARERGYQTEALAFSFSDPAVIHRNLARREAQGGHMPAAHVVSRMLRDFTFFSGSLREIPRDQAPQPTRFEHWSLVQPGLWGRLGEKAASNPRAPQNFDVALQTLPSDERERALRAREEDYFHRVTWVPVRSD